MQPEDAQLWTWVAEVSDPEIPVLSITDLGIVRDIRWVEQRCEVVITPTYAGCPAMQAIEDSIRDVLQRHGVTAEVRTVLSPAWTTDWITDAGRDKLRAYGIAPPAAAAPDTTKAINVSALIAPGTERVACPQCGSLHTRLLSQFGSTACKALYRCTACLETFDYFKPH